MNKKFKKMPRVFAILLVGLFMIACSDSDPGIDKHDPSKPIKLESFMPNEGVIREKFIIKGSNFGSETEKVNVFFDDHKAMVLSVKPDVIYCVVPKQEDGLSTVKVEVDGKAVEFTDQQFLYHVQASISTVVGKAKEAGGKNGMIGETTLNYPRYIAVDNEQNLFVSEADNSRLRMISLLANKSITIYDKALIGQMTFADPEKKQLLGIGDSDRRLYLFDENTGFVPEVLGQVYSAGYIHSITMMPDGKNVLFRVNTGPLMVAPYDGRKGMKPEMSTYLGDVRMVAGGQNGHLVYNPIDGYVYCATHNDNRIWRIKVGSEYTPETTVIEQYVEGGLGFEDGSVATAKFNTPKGIAVDSEGNLYVADEGNHRIRKIDTKNGVVSTVAGTGTAGYEDGDPLKAQLNGPTGVWVDADDFIYIADRRNHCIRKLAIE